MNANSDQFLEVLSQAAQQKSPEERARFLAEACREKPELRREIESLLRAHEEAGEFLKHTLVVPKLEQRGDRIGRYKVLEKIGEGGCGVVYMAEQEEPVRRRVALKVIKLGMDTRNVVARFEAERQALAMMDHPNIAKVLDGGATEAGRPFFVMELVRGIRITEYCDENRLSTKERLDLFIKVCQAIQHAHQKGIIHRDIKPSNVLVTVNDSVPVPKVIDFGIAKATEGRLTDRTLFTAFDQLLGTPTYMSPEQAVMTSLDIDTRADIYSLGVLLYELLVGRTPFDTRELMAAGFEEMCRTIREKDPPKPSTRLGGLAEEVQTTSADRRRTQLPALVNLLRGDLDWIVMKCLEKDRARRYETANGLARDIQRHLTNEPVAARPPSTVYRVQKFVRRNKVTTAAAGAVALTLMLGVLVSSWQAVRATLARKRAVEAEQKEAAQHRQVDEARQHETVLREQAQVQELASRQSAYASDMNLAQQALNANNFGRARRLLNRHRPHANPLQGHRREEALVSNSKLQSPNSELDLRDWEWRYLWQQCRSDAEARVGKLEVGISSLSFGPDGDRLVVATLGGNRAEVWSRQRRQRLLTLTTNGTGGRQSFQAAFSPVAPLLACGTKDGTILVTNLETGSHWNLQTGPRFADRLAFSPDGRVLAALLRDESEKGRVVIWETTGFAALSTNQWERAVSDTYPGGAVHWSAQSDSLWVESLDGLVDKLPADGGRSLLTFRANRAGDTSYSSLAVSASGDSIATGNRGRIMIWDSRTGQFRRSLQGHTAPIGALSFSPDGHWLASASMDQTVRLWDTTHWDSIVLHGHNDEVHALAFTPDGTRLASGSRDGEVLLWRTDSHRSSADRESLPADVDQAVLMPGGRRILACTTNHSLVLIDARSLAVSPLPFAASNAWVLPGGVAVLADGSNRLKFIECDQSGYRILGEMSGRIGGEVAYSPEKRLVAFGSRTSSVTCLSLEPFGPSFQLAGGHGILDVRSFTGGGRLLFGYDENLDHLLWDVEEHNLVHDFPTSASGGLELVVTPERREIVTYSYDNRELSFRDFAQPEEILAHVRLPYTVNLGLSLSPDHHWLAASVIDTGSIHLFDTKSRKLERTFERHLMGACTATFSPNGRRLGTGGNLADAVKLWDVETGQELLTLAGEGAIYWSVQFSDDGNLILAGAEVKDGGVWEIWRAPSWGEIAAAEQAEEKEP